MSSRARPQELLLDKVRPPLTPRGGKSSSSRKREDKSADKDHPVSPRKRDPPKGWENGRKSKKLEFDQKDKKGEALQGARK